MTALTISSFGTNPLWVQLDKKLLNELNSVDKSNCTAVERYFVANRKSPQVKENLGFGWKIWSPGVGGGYVAVRGTFIYFNDSIVSYTLCSDLPDEKHLLQRYSVWLGKTFQIDSGKVVPFEFKTSSILRPLNEYDGRFEKEDIPDRLINYMSPSSGLMYGYAGGINGDLLENRRNFKNIQASLSTDEVYLLKFSINPASRLTAIEYYKRHQKEFANMESIERWIQQVYKETPKVHTLMGCLGETLDSWLLVEFCLRIED
jgi:hypothetical protein